MGLRRQLLPQATRGVSPHFQASPRPSQDYSDFFLEPPGERLCTPLCCERLSAGVSTGRKPNSISTLSGVTTGHPRRALLFLEPPRDSLYSPPCYERLHAGATTGQQRRALLCLGPPRDSLYSPLCCDRLHSGATTGSSKEQCPNTFRWSYRSSEE